MVNNIDIEDTFVVKFLACCAFLIVGILWAYCSFVSPHINVWQQGMEGQAQLAHAEYDRQIATCEAYAKKESAKALAEAEIIRAQGVAEANKIIGDSLNDNESYLRYLWVQGLQTNNMQVVYVPTEANLPIMESLRLR
jgi:regulator of protease activity HflC (stomatin/prohibitin superfamily)